MRYDILVKPGMGGLVKAGVPRSIYDSLTFRLEVFQTARWPLLIGAMRV